MQYGENQPKQRPNYSASALNPSLLNIPKQEDEEEQLFR